MFTNCNVLPCLVCLGTCLFCQGGGPHAYEIYMHMGQTVHMAGEPQVHSSWMMDDLVVDMVELLSMIVAFLLKSYFHIANREYPIGNRESAGPSLEGATRLRGSSPVKQFNSTVTFLSLKSNSSEMKVL